MSTVTPTPVVNTVGFDKTSLDLDEKPDIAHDESPEILRSNYHNLTAGEARRKFKRLYILAISLCIGGMYVGYSIVAPGNVVANPGFIDVMGTKVNPLTGAKELDAVHVSLWSGFTILGQIVGLLIAPVGDTIGRKPTLWIMTVLMVGAILMEMLANDWKVFLGGKILTGISTGMAMAAIPALCAELTMPQFAGSVMGAFALGFSFGQLPCAVALEVLFKTAPLEYRRVFYAQFVVVGLWLIPLLIVPESPMWYASKGKHEKGKKALKHLVGNVEGYDVDHEYAVMCNQLEASKRGARHSWSSLFRGRNLKRTLICCITPTLIYFSGQPLIYGQTAYFFQLAGLADPFVGNLIITILTIVFVVIGNWYVLQRVPRRKAVLGQIAGGFVMLMIIGGLGCIKTTPKVASALIAICSLWVCIFSCTIAVVYWMTLGEIPTASIRQMTITFALIFMNCWGCMWTYVIPILLSPQQAGLATKTCFVFAGVSAPFFPLVYYCLPETLNRSPAAIDELFERGISPRKFATTPTKVEGTLSVDDEVSV